MIKEDIAIIGVNTDEEDFTFLLRTDITTGTEIYFTDNEVDGSGTGLLDTNEGIVLFTANADYSCGTVLGFIQNSAEFSNVSGNLQLANGGDELLAFQGYDNTDDSWTTFLHANVDLGITLPAGFTTTDILDGSQDNREYNGSTNNPSWFDLNDIAEYNEGNDFSTISLSTASFTCTPPCAPTHSITSFNPTSGPIGTYVTIEGNGFTAGTTVNFNDTNATIISQTATQIIAEVEANSSSGLITVTEAGCPVNSLSNFGIIESSGTCSTSNFTDIIITEVYDSDTLNNWYLELYNPTNTDVDLNAVGTDYAIERYGNIGAVNPTRTIDLSGVILANSVFTIILGDSTDNCTFSADLTASGAGINENDEIILLKNGVEIDVVEAPNETGYSILRETTTNGPSATFNAVDWTINGTESCADIGTFNAPAASLPTISSQPTIVNGCLDVSISIMAAAGNSGTLTYQWKYNDGSTTNWLDVTPAAFVAATVTGETTNALFMSGIDLNGYQFYCEVTEDATCSIASNAISTTSSTVTWDGTNWNWNDGTAQNTPPTLSDSVIINGNFDTAGGGLEDSFSACSLTVNAGFNLNVQNDTYIQIQNDIIANGDINVSTRGSVVQVNDLATVLGTGNILVTKETAIMNTANEYTYWSSPTANTTIANGLTDSNPSRRFKFNGANFLDATAETNNNGATAAGQDNIDDDANVWIPVGGAEVMTPGVGYASTHNPLIFFFPGQYQYTFEGYFNNGIYNVPVYRNDSELNDNNWNFIGNPYPSAINAADFFNENAQELNVNGAIKGAIYLWSHVSQANANNNGNQVSNFAQSDYAILNYMGGTEGNTSQGVPNGYVASGQGFFVAMSDAVTPDSTTGDIAQSNVVFNNSMRSIGNNDQFYRNSNTTVERYWLNLTTDNGAFSQILVGYTNNATSNFDGYIFDAPKNINNGVHTALYSNITGESRKFGIQGKSISDLDIDEVVDLGYVTNINEATIYTISLIQFEGSFMTANKIYIKDNLLNIIHNLKDSDYSFTSNIGEFNSRFEIVFQNTALSTNDEIMQSSELKIIEQNNGDLQFKVSRNFNITNVEILDILGRSLYNLDANSSSEIYDLQLNRANYIARVTLSNGQVLSRKIVKQR
ncbi:MAG: T9SS sorting signal type C domain-containing protein [Winogradskyella sp.]